MHTCVSTFLFLPFFLSSLVFRVLYFLDTFMPACPSSFLLSSLPSCLSWFPSLGLYISLLHRYAGSRKGKGHAKLSPGSWSALSVYTSAAVLSSLCSFLPSFLNSLIPSFLIYFLLNSLPPSLPSVLSLFLPSLLKLFSRFLHFFITNDNMDHNK